MKRCVLYVIAIMLVSSLCFALPGVKQWKAVWDANTEADLDHYVLYWKDAGGSFTDANSVECLTNEQSLTGVVPFGSIIAVTASDGSGNESGFSSEVPFDRDGVAPAAPDGLRLAEE